MEYCRWAKGICTDKKRFLCQARVPFCPESWYHPDNSDICYYQSSNTADHLSANHICKYLAIGGYLSPWTPHEALVLGPAFWETSPADEGPAHFWVGIVADKHTEMAMYTLPNATLAMEPPAVTHEGPAAAHEEPVHPTPEIPHEPQPQLTLNHSGFTVETVEPEVSVHFDMSFAFDCAYVYPNKWADYTYNSVSDHDAKPGFVCAKNIQYETAGEP